MEWRVPFMPSGQYRAVWRAVQMFPQMDEREMMRGRRRPEDPWLMNAHSSLGIAPPAATTGRPPAGRR